MSFSNLKLRKRNLDLETAAGKLAQARADAAIGVPGAMERQKHCLEEFERLRSSQAPIQDAEDTTD